MRDDQRDEHTPGRTLVLAGGSTGTGALVAALARARGWEVRTVGRPERCLSLSVLLAGAEGVVLVPARGITTVGAQVRAVVDACWELGRVAPHVVLVTGFSVGHGPAHALNTPERLADLLAAEDLLRSSGDRYTIVRPTWLTQDPPGRYALTLTQDPCTDGMVARADLARICLAAIDRPEARAKTFAVFAEPGAAPARWAPAFAALAPDERSHRPEQVIG
jgi:uncharacterized protein YbjT (DUF2867 family)